MPIQLVLFDLDLYTVEIPMGKTQVEKPKDRIEPQIEYVQLELDLFAQSYDELLPLIGRKSSKLAA